MAVPPRRLPRLGKLDAGVFGADVASFGLHLAAEGKAAKTIRTYTEAVRWFAAAHLLARQARPAGSRWTGRISSGGWCGCWAATAARTPATSTARCSSSSNGWPPKRSCPTRWPGCAAAGDRASWSRSSPAKNFGLDQACAGRTFAQRRDAAIIAVFKATGIRLAELAGIRYDPGDPRRSDIDLWQREITVRGKGGKPRIVRIGHQAARSLDRYLRARARHAQAWRPQLWLGVSNRGPLTAAGIYQMIARRGQQCGVDVYPHRFRHHFSHTWLDRGGAEGDLMELNGWTSPQMLRRYGASARSARARRTYDRIMDDGP